MHLVVLVMLPAPVDEVIFEHEADLEVTDRLLIGCNCSS